MSWRGHSTRLQLWIEHSGVAVRSTQRCQRHVETKPHPEDDHFPVGDLALRCGFAPQC